MKLCFALMFLVFTRSVGFKPRDALEAPSFTVDSVYPCVKEIEVKMTLNQDGKVACLAVEPASPVPAKGDFSSFETVQANTPFFYSIPNLKENTSYNVYCYSENTQGVASSLSIEASKQSAKTVEEADAPVVIIGNVQTDRVSASISVASTMSGTLWCLLEADAGHIPTRQEVHDLGAKSPITEYTETSITVSDLKSGSKYYGYCTVESGAGVPTSSVMKNVRKLVETEEPAEPWYIITLRLLLTAILVCFSGLFSGLNLGLMGLDLMSLQMISDTNIEEVGGDNMDPQEVKDLIRDKEYATKILPVRKKGNLLLCTLLIGNVMVNTLISILTADMTSGTIGFIISTVLITAFGEVIPQAYGSRNGLKLGANTVQITNVLICVLYIICKPVSMLLDACLGDEFGSVYNRYQLYTMFELYKDCSDFKKDTISTMQGALVMDTKSVMHYYHKLSDIYMLPDTTILDTVTCMEIFKKGYSRIPIYHEERQNIVGVLHVKELIMVDPNQSVCVDALLKLFPSTVLAIDMKRTVADSIKDMVNSHTELAFVSETVEHPNSDNTIELRGIVTMEDLIRAVMRLDLVDETPVIESEEVANAVENVFGKVLLNHLDSTTTDIISYFINQTLGKQHLYLPSDVIVSLIQHGAIEHVTTTSQPIYEIGKPCDYLTVIMQGIFTVTVGQDHMVTEKPAFSVINLSAILDDEYM